VLRDEYTARAMTEPRLPTTPPFDDDAMSAPDSTSAAEQLFERWRKRAGIVLAPAIFALVFATTDQMKPEGRHLAAVLAAVAVLWTCETLPLPVTALLGAALCVLLGVAPAKQVLGYFADPIVFVFLGSFMLARAMMLHRLDRRIALGFLSIQWIARSHARVMAGLGCITALISMWVSNTATTAMMLPIALGELGALRDARSSPSSRRATSVAKRGQDPLNAGSLFAPRGDRPYAAGTMLMIAYAASIGGIGTPVGSPPNLIGIGLIRRATGFEINFFKWMALCVPLLVVMGVVLFILLNWLHPAERGTGNTRVPPVSDQPDTGQTPVLHAHGITDYLAREREALGPWTRGQINTLLAFAVAVFLWMLPGILSLPIWPASVAPASNWLNARLPESIVALLAAILLFVLPTDAREGRFTLAWHQAAQIDWGTILLFGGGLALGTLMFEKGVADALGDALTRRLGVSSLWPLTGLSIALGIVLSEATSNTAAANMVIPVVIGLAQGAGVSAVPPALGACLGASYGFMLPVSTPPNAIVYGSGLVPIPAMIRAGILFDICGFIIIWAGLRVMCPVLSLI
jgi:sodium-dependent dicarboxylate transporter 2/3/5